MDINNGRYIYHLTDLNNLNSIIKNGLLSRNELNSRNCNFTDVANPDIILKRKDLYFNDYVPFHFYPHSPFDAAVKNSYPEIEFIYICIHRNLARARGFVISPMHPLSSNGKLYNYDEGFDMIDWETMNTVGVKNEYFKKVKMSECLYKNKIDISFVHAIGVRNKEIESYVKAMLAENNISGIFVDVHKEWFRKEDAL